MNDLADRRRDEKERRREEILDATARVAAELGFEQLTMDQVARRARLSRALLYVYFKDKADLQFGLCERALEDLHQRFILATAQQGSGREQLEAMGRAYIALAQDAPVYFDALTRFQASADDPRAGNYATCIDGSSRVHRVMTDAIHRGMQDGSIRRDVGAADTVAIVLWGLLHGVIQLVATKGELLGARGVTAQGLFDQALDLASHALKARA